MSLAYPWLLSSFDGSAKSYSTSFSSNVSIAFPALIFQPSR